MNCCLKSSKALQAGRVPLRTALPNTCSTNLTRSHSGARCDVHAAFNIHVSMLSALLACHYPLWHPLTTKIGFAAFAWLVLVSRPLMDDLEQQLAVQGLLDMPIEVMEAICTFLETRENVGLEAWHA
jgi:hypothetical protein